MAQRPYCSEKSPPNSGEKSPGTNVQDPAEGLGKKGSKAARQKKSAADAPSKSAPPKLIPGARHSPRLSRGGKGGRGGKGAEGGKGGKGGKK